MEKSNIFFYVNISSENVYLFNFLEEYYELLKLEYYENTWNNIIVNLCNNGRLGEVNLI